MDAVDAGDCGAYKAVVTNNLGKSIGNTAVVVTRKLTYNVEIIRFSHIINK